MSTGKTWQSGWQSGGLIFLGMKDLDVVSVGNRVSNTLDALGEAMSGVRVLSDYHVQIVSNTLIVKIALLEDKEIRSVGRTAAAYLSIRIAPRRDEAGRRSMRGDAVLAFLLRALNRTLAPDYIQWMEAETVISHADFATATAQLRDPETDRRAERDAGAGDTGTGSRRARSLPRIEAAEDGLYQRFEEKSATAATPHDEQLEYSLRSIFRQPADELAGARIAETEDECETLPAMRLSAWFLSFAVALFALPMGAALIVYSLLRGENLRLTSQAAALTGIFVALQAFGTTAQAADVITTLLS